MTLEITEKKVAYSPESAARALDVSMATLRRWMKDGSIRYIKPEGFHRVLIPATELDKFLSNFKGGKNE